MINILRKIIFIISLGLGLLMLTALIDGIITSDKSIAFIFLMVLVILWIAALFFVFVKKQKGSFLAIITPLYVCLIFITIWMFLVNQVNYKTFLLGIADVIFVIYLYSYFKRS